jgi:transcriptional regulator with XRE-family HTH domain
MDFQTLQSRLVQLLLRRVRNGELSERGLARLTGVSQPHIHNVLKGKRFFSLEKSDHILRELDLDLFDLVQPEDLVSWPRRH